MSVFDGQRFMLPTGRLASYWEPCRCRGCHSGESQPGPVTASDMRSGARVGGGCGLAMRPSETLRFWGIGGEVAARRLDYHVNVRALALRIKLIHLRYRDEIPCGAWRWFERRISSHCAYRLAWDAQGWVTLCCCSDAP